MTLGPWFTTQGLITLSAVADYIIELQKKVKEGEEALKISSRLLLEAKSREDPE